MKSKQELQERADGLRDHKLFLQESIDELRIINAKLWTVNHFISEIVETSEASGDLYDGDKKDIKIGQAFEKNLYKAMDYVYKTGEELDKLLRLREEQLQEVKYKLDALNF